MVSVETRLYAVRTTAGQELNVALLIERRSSTHSIPVKSVVAPDDVRGYVFVEAAGPHVVDLAISGLKHVKGYVAGKVEFEGIRRLIQPKSVLEDLEVSNIVEIVSGPFRGLKAKVTRIDKSKSEVTLEPLEVTYTLPITISASYLRIVAKEEGEKRAKQKPEESEEESGILSAFKKVKGE